MSKIKVSMKKASVSATLGPVETLVMVHRLEFSYTNKIVSVSSYTNEKISKYLKKSKEFKLNSSKNGVDSLGNKVKREEYVASDGKVMLEYSGDTIVCTITFNTVGMKNIQKTQKVEKQKLKAQNIGLPKVVVMPGAIYWISTKKSIVNIPNPVVQMIDPTEVLDESDPTSVSLTALKSFLAKKGFKDKDTLYFIWGDLSKVFYVTSEKPKIFLREVPEDSGIGYDVKSGCLIFAQDIIE